MNPTLHGFLKGFSMGILTGTAILTARAFLGPRELRQTRLWATAVSAVMFTSLVVLAVTLGGCATATYDVSYRALADNSPPWLTDGSDGQVTVYNRTDARARFTVECAGAPQDWVVEVEPRGQVSTIGQLMAVHTRGDACRVTLVEEMCADGWREKLGWREGVRR
jgi:hypothetical protein